MVYIHARRIRIERSIEVPVDPEKNIPQIQDAFAPSCIACRDSSAAVSGARLFQNAPGRETADYRVVPGEEGPWDRHNRRPGALVSFFSPAPSPQLPFFHGGGGRSLAGSEENPEIHPPCLPIMDISPETTPELFLPESRTEHVYPVIAVLMGLGAGAVGLRFYSRAVVIRNLGFDDWIALASLVLLFAFGAVTFVSTFSLEPPPPPPPPPTRALGW